MNEVPRDGMARNRDVVPQAHVKGFEIHLEELRYSCAEKRPGVYRKNTQPVYDAKLRPELLEGGK